MTEYSLRTCPLSLPRTILRFEQPVDCCPPVRRQTQLIETVPKDGWDQDSNSTPLPARGPYSCRLWIGDLLIGKRLDLPYLHSRVGLRSLRRSTCDQRREGDPPSRSANWPDHRTADPRRHSPSILPGIVLGRDKGQVRNEYSVIDPQAGVS